MSINEYETEAWAPRTSSVFQPLRTHWRPAAAVTLAGALLGALVGFLLPVTYTAESRVAVGMGDLTSGAIAGFPTAAETLASNYARYVNDTGVTTGSVPEGVELAASNIPESNVLRIEASAPTPEVATQVAGDTANTLVTTVNENDAVRNAEATLQRYRDAQNELRTATSVFNTYDAEVARLEGTPGVARETLEGARGQLNSAITTRETIQAQVDGLRALYIRQVSEDSEAANLVLVREASVVSTSRSGAVQRGALLGTVIGALAGLALANARARRPAAAPADEASEADAAHQVEATDGAHRADEPTLPRAERSRS